jgi:hypothetical protein
MGCGENDRMTISHKGRRFRVILHKNRIRTKRFSADQSESDRSRWAGSQGDKRDLWMFEQQCDRAKDFFIWIRCNPLKSPDSDE